jgi:hypothetical protein
MITVASDAAFNVGTGDFSVAQWAIFDTSGLQTSVSRRAWNEGWQLGKDASNRFQAHVAGTPVGASTTLTLGIPYHLVLVRVSGVAYLHLNGLYDSTAAATGDVDGAYSLYIGSQAGNANWADGAVWDTRIYSVALTGAEVWELYRRGRRGL